MLPHPEMSITFITNLTNKKIAEGSVPFHSTLRLTGHYISKLMDASSVSK